MYSCEVEVRYADLDAYGHVNHATFLTYLETVRTKLFINEFNELLTKNIFLIIVRVECDYKHPIHLGDKVIIDIKTDEIKRTSFTLSYTIHNGNGITYAEAKTTLVSFDNSKKRAIEIPPELKNKLVS
ncbi:MAG: acyl-CoA thioesterase [Calditerrivibrio sp.]|nr:acyl-CoA thioesterase [Calditerrivibrio sp.]